MPRHRVFMGKIGSSNTSKLFEPEPKYYPLKWWQLWRVNPEFGNRTYRYRWVRFLFEQVGQNK